MAATIYAREQSVHRAQPHTWQTRLWARIVRRLGRRWVMSRHVARYCSPLTIEGRSRLRGVRGPVIVIANHSSHFDTPVALSTLPERLRARTAVAAAADKFYRRDKRGWWFSLFYNAYPIERGGGRAALDYSLRLLDRGWSLIVYPEGTRSINGEVAAFHHGATILAMQANVPVVPMYTEGLRAVMPKGEREPRPSPVRVRVGAPVSLRGVGSIEAGTRRLEDAFRALTGERPRVTAASPALDRVPALSR